jgi:hypothetical protein
MKNVYTLSFEGTKAFSTARKVVEFAQANYSDWLVTTGFKDTGLGFEECVQEELKTANTSKLIKLLNDQGFLLAEQDNLNSLEINKCNVN